MLPNFLIIGAEKSGSTSLREYLRAHPQVFVTRKEVKFFTDHWWRGREWYEEQFEGSDGAVARGEGSALYTMYPQYTGVPRRMARLVPDAKLVYIVRDPVRRMQSRYHHKFAFGSEREDVGTVLSKNPEFLNPSLYAFQLEQYMQYFARDQLLVVVFEELRDDRSATLRRVYDFLGADPDWWSSEVEDQFNVSTQLTRQRPLIRRAMTFRPGRRLIEATPAWAKERVRGVTHHSPPDPEMTMSAELRQELEDLLRDDVRRLRSYLPPSFDGWGIA